jgi:hypothetical protein
MDDYESAALPAELGWHSLLRVYLNVQFHPLAMLGVVT